MSSSTASGSSRSISRASRRWRLAELEPVAFEIVAQRATDGSSSTTSSRAPFHGADSCRGDTKRYQPCLAAAWRLPAQSIVASWPARAASTKERAMNHHFFSLPSAACWAVSAVWPPHGATPLRARVPEAGQRDLARPRHGAGVRLLLGRSERLAEPTAWSRSAATSPPGTQQGWPSSGPQRRGVDRFAQQRVTPLSASSCSSMSKALPV